MRVTGRDKFKKFKKIINVLVLLFSILPYNINYFLLNVFQNYNGKFGLLLRFVLVKNLAEKCGDNVSIHPNVYLLNLKNINFGNNISIHPLCYIDGAGGITINDNVSIAHNCTLLSVNHTWVDLSVPIKYNPETLSSTCVEDDVWLGCGVRVMAGVTIRKRTIVAAGAVVTKTFEPYSLIAGIPAKIIKKINE